MVDVSHASDAAFEQIRRVLRGPFVASHSNCRALSPAPRNLTDAQIRALADQGGVMGINLAPDFLSPEYLAAWDAVMAPAHGADAATRQKIREAAGPQLRASPLPGLDWIARHVRHAIAIGGEACIGLGGDLDGISFMPAGIDGVEVLRKVKETQPEIEVIILTGHGSDKDREICMALGAFAYLQKPVDIDKLSATIQAANERIRRRQAGEGRLPSNEEG